MIYKLIVPLHRQWLQQHGADSPAWVTTAAGGGCGLDAADWASLLPLVVSCNSMLAAIVKVSELAAVATRNGSVFTHASAVCFALLSTGSLPKKPSYMLFYPNVWPPSYHNCTDS